MITDQELKNKSDGGKQSGGVLEKVNGMWKDLEEKESIAKYHKEFNMP